MQPLKKISPESIRAIARNPNIDLQSIGIYSKSDIQHHIRTQQFRELLTQMDTIQRQSIDKIYENLQKQQDFQIFTHKITAETLKTSKITYIKSVKNFDHKIYHQLIILVL